MAATITIHSAQSQIVIESRLYLYGSEATQAIGQEIVTEINRMYNEPEVYFLYKEQTLKVVFSVSFKIVSTTEAMFRAATNQNFRNNFIRIENENHITRSFMGYGLGDNVGHWLTTDQLGNSTTAAHEFGHSLGLDHPVNLDFRGQSTPPPIMAPRGSLTNPEFQWNPSASPGEFGGTMNPKYRKVTAEEVLLVLQNANFENNQTSYVGQLSNTLFNRQGEPSRWIV